MSDFCNKCGQSLLFQFHKGAIGVQGSRPLLRQFGVFQFHKGAIGVFLEVSCQSFLLLFQFHKGAIGVT